MFPTGRGEVLLVATITLFYNLTFPCHPTHLREDRNSDFSCSKCNPFIIPPSVKGKVLNNARNLRLLRCVHGCVKYFRMLKRHFPLLNNCRNLRCTFSAVTVYICGSLLLPSTILSAEKLSAAKLPMGVMS
jgi:hypothetical protein